MPSTTEQTQKNDIIIIAVIHDDVPAPARKTIYADHFQPLVSELESFTERKVNVVFAGGAPYSNFQYKGEEHEETVKRWAASGIQLLDEMRSDGVETNNVTKVILITNNALKGGFIDPFNPLVTGVALLDLPDQTGTFAIASLLTYRSVAYEIGILLGGKPEDSETQFNGWFAETYMTQYRDWAKSNSYTFSAANRQNIKNYLAEKDKVAYLSLSSVRQ